MEDRTVYYDGSKVEAYHKVMNYCLYTCREEEWADGFWMRLLGCPEVYREVLYYLEHHEFLDECQIEGFSPIDIFIWYMKKYNLHRDKGRSSSECDKEIMSILAFDALTRLKREPEFKQELMRELGIDRWPGMDK